MANISNNILKTLPHQKEAYENVEKLFQDKGKAAVIFPTGCGKSFVVLKYILEHPDDRILFLSPRNAIKNQMYEYVIRFIGGDNRPIEEIKKEYGTGNSECESLRLAAKQYIPNIECMLYQTILGIGEKDSIDDVMDKLRPDLIVVDEMHHLKTKLNRETSISSVIDDEIDSDEFLSDEENSEKIKQENKWGEKFNKLLEMNPQAKLLGLSATPIRTDGANVVERIFEDSIASEISLLEAIEQGIIYAPKYVVPDFIREDELKTLLEKIEDTIDESQKENLKEEYNELVKKSTKALGLPELLKENITEIDGKYIIFCKDISDMEDKMSKAKEWFGDIDNEPEIYGIHSKDKTSTEQLENFNKSDSEHLKLMYCVGMIDEGVHLNGVSGVILASKTGSRPTYLQRIGRAISSGKDKKQTLVIDLVNNNEILFNDKNVQHGYEIKDIEALEKLIEWIKMCNDGKWPEYSQDKTVKEQTMAKRLARLNNKYLKYVKNPEFLDNVTKEKIAEITDIIELGKDIGLFEEFIEIDFGDENPTNVDIDEFLKDIEIKGVRRDIRGILKKVFQREDINLKNFEEYKVWCEENNRLPKTKINGINSAKSGEKETEEQREQRLGQARMAFFRNNINKKENITEENEFIKNGYLELDEKYKKSLNMKKFEEYQAWCEKNGRLPSESINGVRAIKKIEKQEEQIEVKLAKTRAKFFSYYINKKENIIEENELIKNGYLELDEKYKENVNMKNFEEYKIWCEKNSSLPRSTIIGIKTAKPGEKETEEQREQRLGKARSSFFRNNINKNENITEENEIIKNGYLELTERYKPTKSSKKIAQVVKGVSVTELPEASEFLDMITAEKSKEGVNKDD